MFTEKILRDFFKKREWEGVDRLDKNFDDTYRKENFGIDLGFQYNKNGFILSIIAGNMLYSIPRSKVTRYQAVEIGLIVNDKLQYFDGAEFFKHDIESYVDWERFLKIVKWVEKSDEVSIAAGEL